MLKLKRTILCAVAVSAFAAIGGEALVRADFEFDGMTGYLGWSRLFCKNGEGTVEPIPGGGPGGKPAMRVSGKADRNTFFTTPLTLVEGEPYRLSALVRTKGLVAGKGRMLLADDSWTRTASTGIPADTAGEWKRISATLNAPAAKAASYRFGFEISEFPDGAYLDVCEPALKPLSKKAKDGSSSLGNAGPLIVRIVPVEPLLSEVDADTGYIRFMANTSTNGCTIVAKIDGKDPGPIAEGPHEVTVKLVETATGKVRCENTYPFTAKKRKPPVKVGRKLNNFVTEVLNVELKDGIYKFTNPRKGQVFIGFEGCGDRAKAYLSGIREPVITYRRDEPFETIRTLEPGDYTLKVEGAAGGRLRVHLVKPLSINCNRAAIPHCDVRSAATCLAGWDFYRKCILPSCGVARLAVGDRFRWPKERVDRFFPYFLSRGKVITGNTGIGPTKHKELADREYVRSRLRGHPQYQAGYVLDWDEFGLHASARDLNFAGEEMWELVNERRANAINADFFGVLGRELKDFSPVVALVSAVVNSGCGTGYLISETYARARPDIADLDKQIDSIIANQRRLAEMVPESARRIIHLLNGFQTIGSWTSHLSPEVDEKVLLDHMVYRMANEPEFADVGGLATTSPYCSEEILRWEAALLRHYGILGRTDSMAEARGWKYNPGTVKNGDFDEGFAHWTVEPAEAGSVTNITRKGFGSDLQRRVGAAKGMGDSFAVLTRSAKGPNRLIQKVGNLKPGEWYTFEFATADYANVLQPRSAYDREPQLWAEVKGMPIDERYSGHHFAPAGANNWKLKKISCPFRTSRYVFQATSPEAEVCITDWKGASEPGGPVGRRATLNYISVRPYFKPSGTEIDICDDFDVTAFGAKGDGKTLDTAAIQAALDACAKTGGTVKVPKGTYLTGTLKIGSDTELYLEKDAVLLGSPNLSDYAPDDVYPGSHGSKKEGWSAKHLIVAFNARNVAITGSGAIDGNAQAFMSDVIATGTMTWRRGYRQGKGRREECNRPGQQIVFVGCENVRIEGVTFRNMNCWTCLIHGCVDVVVRNATVRNEATYANTDGFDIDSSRNVTVTGCDIDTGDDAFAIRGDNGPNLYDGAPSRKCEDILISNCVCSTSACGVRVGVGRGSISNVTVTALDVKTAEAGMFLHTCYGGAKHGGVEISDIRFSDIRVRDAVYAIRVSANGINSCAKMENISFDRIDAESSAQLEVCGSGTTVPDGISFRNVKFRMTDLPPNVSYPRPTPTFVERAGRVEFIDCDFSQTPDEDPAAVVAREEARRAALPKGSILKGFEPLTIELTREEAEKNSFKPECYPVDLKAGRRYRISYFVKGEGITPLVSTCGATSAVWVNEKHGTKLGSTGYRMNGTFGRYLQSYEIKVPDPLPPNFRPEISLRLFRSYGKAVFDGLFVEEIPD